MDGSSSNEENKKIIKESMEELFKEKSLPFIGDDEKKEKFKELSKKYRSTKKSGGRKKRKTYKKQKTKQKNKILS